MQSEAPLWEHSAAQQEDQPVEKALFSIKAKAVLSSLEYRIQKVNRSFIYGRKKMYQL